MEDQEDQGGSPRGLHKKGYTSTLIEVFQEVANSGGAESLSVAWSGEVTTADADADTQGSSTQWTVTHPFQVASESGGPDGVPGQGHQSGRQGLQVKVPSLNLLSNMKLDASKPAAIRDAAKSMPVAQASRTLTNQLSVPPDRASLQAKTAARILDRRFSLGWGFRGISITNIPTPFAFASKKTLANVLEAGPDESYSGQSTPREMSVQHTAESMSAGLGDLSKVSSSVSPRMSDRRSASQRWKGAVHSIVTMTSVSKQFRTLRDMQVTNQIPRESIKVVNVIGKGAFAIVERCVWQPKGGRPILVAVKRLKPDLTRNDEDLRDLLQEVTLLRKLKHRHVVKFLGFGYWEFATSASSRQGSLFIVEELVDGGNLKTCVLRQMGDSKARHYRSEDALRWLRQVALGLAYLHRSEPQVIHRDLKLENILLKGKDVMTSEAKLADFGLSALVRRTSVYSDLEKRIHTSENTQPQGRASMDMENSWSTAAEQRTKTSVDMAHPPAGGHHKLDVATAYEQLSGRTGTLMYMAPEVFNQLAYNEKADVFSWAIIAYELLHRYIMITATDGSFEECKAYARRVSQGFRPPIHKHMPQELAEVLTRCWCQDSASRPDMASIALELQQLATSLDLDAFDRAVLGKAYTEQLVVPSEPQTPLCGCTIA